MDPRRLTRLECRGDKENRAILEAPNASDVEAPAIGQVILPQRSTPGVGYLAISDKESSAGGYGALHVLSRQEKEHAAFMACRTPVSRRSARAPPSAGGSADSGDFSMVSDNGEDRARRTCVPASAQGVRSESLPDGSDSNFTFGQHVGLSYHEVLHRYPVITYGERSRSHLARVWQTFWIGPLTTMRLMVNPMKPTRACCLWK